MRTSLLRSGVFLILILVLSSSFVLATVTRGEAQVTGSGSEEQQSTLFCSDELECKEIDSVWLSLLRLVGFSHPEFADPLWVPFRDGTGRWESFTVVYPPPSREGDTVGDSQSYIPSGSPACGAASYSDGSTEENRLINAYLDSIAFAEGTGDKYDIVVNGRVEDPNHPRLDRDKNYNAFLGYQSHPGIFVYFRDGTCRTGNSLTSACSSAAGRYQFIQGTWNSIAESNNLDSFSPANQDRGAWALAQSTGVTVDLLRQARQSGDFSDVSHRTGAHWVSFPRRNGESIDPRQAPSQSALGVIFAAFNECYDQSGQSSSAQLSRDPLSLDSSTRILHLGASHTVGHYGTLLHNYFVSSGAHVETYAVTGSSPSSWISGDFGLSASENVGNSRRRVGSTSSTWMSSLQSASSVLSSRESDQTDHNFDVVLVSLGTNAISGYSSAASSFRQLAQLLSGSGSRECFWVGPGDLGSNARSQLRTNLGAAVTAFEAAVQEHCTYIDARSADITSAQIINDGVHYTNPGATVLAEYVLDQVIPASSRLVASSSSSQTVPDGSVFGVEELGP